MNREFRSIPFARVVIFWIIGILIGKFFSISVSYFVPLGAILVFLMALRLRLSVLMQLSAMATIISLSMIRAGHSNTNDLVEVFDANVLVRLSESIVEKEKTFQLKGEIIACEGISGPEYINAGILLFCSKEERPDLTYGDHFLVKTDLDKPKPPTNPGQFDYAAYLETQGITYTSFVSEMDIQKLDENSGSSIWTTVLGFREGAISAIEQNIASSEHQEILKALLVGDRSQLSSEVRERFSSTGTIHIMAVSGLHVGIIYGIFFLILRYQENRRNRWLLSVLALLSIWSFAAITGFAAPVQRACIMFTVLLLATLLNKQSNIYNSLAFSAFLILIINPMELFQAGFQLSYAAVLGIVFFQPRLYNLFEAKSWLIDKVWMLATISIASQLLTAPLILYYFNQFPTYFLVSNIIVVPLVPVILYLGFILLILAGIGVTITYTWQVFEMIVVSTTSVSHNLR
jgi:competence protein ComEC